MNNSVLTLATNNSNEIKFELHQPSTPNIGLTLDQAQLLQITQLMNELQQQQHQQQIQSECLSIADIQNEQQITNQQMEIVVNSQNSNQNVILSPNSLAKLDQQIQIQSNQASNIQQLFLGQTDTQQSQVHTIMLNGQPALFIPASAPLSASFLSQIQLLQNNIQPQLDLLNTDYSHLLTSPAKDQSQVKTENIEQDLICIQPDTQNVTFQIEQQNKTKKKLKPKNKVSNLLTKAIQPQPSPSQLPVQLQLIQQTDQQWILVNNEQTNTTTTTTTTTTIPTVQNTEQNGEKKKRKACDCPNCVHYKQNPNKEEMTKRRTHKCHKCDKEYNKTSHLRAHLRAHDNYRPYVCDFRNCNKSFTRSDELKRHKRIHFDDRNFTCQICKKKFLRSDHLSKHLLVHSKSGGVRNGIEKKNGEQQQQVEQVIGLSLNLNSVGSSSSASSTSAESPTTSQMLV